MKTCGTERRPLRAIISSRRLRILIDVDDPVREPLLRQQPLGPLTVRTPAGHIEHDGGRAHLDFALPAGVLVKGRLSLTHAFNPPSRLNTLVKPSLAKVRAAPAPLTPLSQ